MDDHAYERLEHEWQAVHGRTPTRDERAEMMDQATVRSRQRKTRGDVDLHEQWRATVDVDDLAAVNGLVAQSAPVSDGGRLLAGSAEFTDAVFAELHEQRAWWSRAHVTSEVARLIAEPTPEVIELETERIITLCVPLEPDDDAEYADPSAARYTSTTICEAEARVLNATNDPATFTVTPVRDPQLGDDQLNAVEAIAAGDGRVATVVGPAGAGKTTMLRSVAASLAAGHRDVVVLTLSAGAARVVTDETGLAADTIETWRVGGVDMPRDGLVIVDEASMVPTLVLDEMIRVAAVYRSKVALLGDYAQMGAPAAGGLLRDLAALPSAVELTAVRRFANRWERTASKQLRARNAKITATYERHGRIIPAATDTVFDAAAAGWWADTQAGASALVVTDTAADAAEVNTRCQHHLIVAGRLGIHVADAADGTRIHIGDQIQTRRNTSEIRASDRRRILNRDVWTVTGCLPDGSLEVKHAKRSARAVLPADYVAVDVVLAYATTIAGAQGRTVDRGHVIVTPRTILASLYVGLTRGKRRNHAYVVCDSHDHTEFEFGDLTPAAAFAAAVTRDPDSQLSATTIDRRWRTGADERTAARAADRQRRHVTDWWDRHQRTLPGPVQTALSEHDGPVLDALTSFSSDRQREQAVTRAVAGIDWRSPRAANRFLARLGTLQRGAAKRSASTTVWQRASAGRER